MFKKIYKKFFSKKEEDYTKYSKEAQMIMNCSFSILLNANDFFNYACADAEEMDEEDTYQLYPIIRKYGYDAINAYMSHKRGVLPINPHRTTKFFKALEEVKKIQWEWES